jgi:hypothetical protein
MRNVILQAVLPLFTMSCTHSVHQVHTSGFTPYKSSKVGKPIQMRTEQFVIMGFTDNTDYVDQAYEGIQSRCVGGKIKGMTTQFSTSHGFFSWTNKILIQGQCLRKSKS